MRSLSYFSFAIISALAGQPAALCQSLLNGTTTSDGMVRIMYADQAVFEAGEPRSDLPCQVTSVKPSLGFDLRYHSGFDATVPLRDLVGADNLLSILFRVTPVQPAGEPFYFTQKIRVPNIEEDARGEAQLQGAFDLGEGKYKVDWLMRDRVERVCASSWEIEATLGPKDKEMALAMERGEVKAAAQEKFTEEPPVARTSDDAPLNVKVLINFAPQNANSPALKPVDTTALVSILRNISRDPRIGRFSLVAFNLHERRVLYRQDGADKIDFPGLGEAVSTMKLGTVDLQRLQDKNGDTEFLAGLIRQECSAETTADALVFAGPKAMLEESVPQDTLKGLEIGYPVFYMNYNLYPQEIPWNDTIGKAVKFLKGYEYTISKPRDLWFAVSEMVSRIAKVKQSRRSGTSSSE